VEDAPSGTVKKKKKTAAEEKFDKIQEERVSMAVGSSLGCCLVVVV
jgi:hypothetical protein